MVDFSGRFNSSLDFLASCVANRNPLSRGQWPSGRSGDGASRQEPVTTTADKKCSKIGSTPQILGKTYHISDVTGLQSTLIFNSTLGWGSGRLRAGMRARLLSCVCSFSPSGAAPGCRLLLDCAVALAHPDPDRTQAPHQVPPRCSRPPSAAPGFQRFSALTLFCTLQSPGPPSHCVFYLLSLCLLIPPSLSLSNIRSYFFFLFFSSSSLHLR